jgi:uncharacterized membrane protein YeiB
MSSSAASNSASGSAADINSSTGTSKMALYAIIGCAIAGLISYIVSFIMTSKFLGSADNWKEIQPIFSSIYGPALAGAIILCVALGIYINQMLTNPNVLYIIMVISVLALCFSYTAVAMAVITKSA